MTPEELILGQQLKNQIETISFSIATIDKKMDYFKRTRGKYLVNDKVLVSKPSWNWDRKEFCKYEGTIVHISVEQDGEKKYKLDNGQIYYKEQIEPTTFNEINITTVINVNGVKIGEVPVIPTLQILDVTKEKLQQYLEIYKKAFEEL